MISDFQLTEFIDQLNGPNVFATMILSCFREHPEETAKSMRGLLNKPQLVQVVKELRGLYTIDLLTSTRLVNPLSPLLFQQLSTLLIQRMTQFDQLFKEEVEILNGQDSKVSSEI